MDEKKTLSEHIYGSIPERPLHLSAETISIDPSFAAGDASFNKMRLLLDFGTKKSALPFTTVIPNSKKPYPAIISINYESSVPNKYLPAEEIAERGYGIFAFSYKDVSECDGNFKSGLSAYIAKSRRKKSAPGKIALWAYAILRLVDYLSDLEEVDKDSIIVAGHGLLGKAALLAATFDERIKYVIANDSYAFGRGMRASECVIEADYLFCPAFSEPSDYDDLNDQALLIKGCMTRQILLGSADDARSDPDGEAEAIELADEHRGNIFFNRRNGSFYFGRRDWNIYLDQIDKKRQNDKF